MSELVRWHSDLHFKNPITLTMTLNQVRGFGAARIFLKREIKLLFCICLHFILERSLLIPERGRLATSVRRKLAQYEALIGNRPIRVKFACTRLNVLISL